MGFEVKVKAGDAGDLWLRGNSDGGVEMCKWGDITNPKTKEVTQGLIPFKWYSNIQQAFDRVARMRIASAQANDLKELVTAIKAIRLDILREMGALN